MSATRRLRSLAMADHLTRKFGAQGPYKEPPNTRHRPSDTRHGAWRGQLLRVETNEFAAWFRNGRSRRDPRLPRKTAFQRFPPVHRIELEGPLRVEFTRSPS